MPVHKITPIDGALADLLNKTFTENCREGYVNVDGCVLPTYYKKFADAIENFEVRNDDVWVCGFPKTGTTWTQEMVWSIANDFSLNRGGKHLYEKFTLIDACLLFEKVEPARCDPAGEMGPTEFLVDSVNYAKNMPSPRFIKSHLPIDLLPRELRTGEKRPKIIYVCRDPKDTCISYYHFCKLMMGFEGSFEEFCALFIGDTVYYGPFWKNVLSFWNARNDHNMLFLKYEDMKKDLPSAIKMTANFLGKEATRDQVSMLAEHLTFTNMKASQALNKKDTVSLIQKLLDNKNEGVFMRSGTSGQWRTVMTPELIEKFYEWTSGQLDGTGLKFETLTALRAPGSSHE